ncbi:hypothetical protein Q4E93_11855 [Flavitalea sp. BT771]|uniref:hypothetical protein n=1 Tax=Flavitalea sp. BT771 TaxID=3063329 RepID=UPI0026E35996|nr:hypothetical protein [Flavitalea sp. BT771]MDO6431287.1 hypothetical protein [Flavitalea sp. BT771]MDV6220195.1 hypothetical protein [Flavitalea sp. BT771]
MHDPKFEKEVQQKLEELSFSPSDAVWTRVEQAVNGKKRRRVPVFWLFLLPALVMTGAGVIYFSGTRKVPATAMAQRPAIVPASPVTSPAATPPASPSTASSLPAAAPTSSAPANPVYPSSTATSAHTNPTYTKPTDTYRPSSGMSVVRQSHARRAAPAAISGVAAADETSGEGVLSGHSAEAAVSSVKSVASTATAKAVTARVTLPGRNDFGRHYAAPTAARLPTTSQAFPAKAPIRLKPKYSWESGFAGGIGLSSQNKTLFQQPTIMSDLSPNAAPITGRPKTYTSQVQPDLSYWAGIVVQRPLSKVLTLSLGLDLHYYSTKVQIGEKVDNSLSASSSPSLLTGQSQYVQTAAAYPYYYSVGNKDVFVNRYYFLELPGSVVWQVNHSRNLPLFWEGGFSLAYLVSSNALYFNSKSGVFYKDGNATKKTQINLTTALLVGLPIRGLRLQAGPQVQYGLTSLQSQGSGMQHLFYGGLRLVLLPGKAKN